MTNAPDASNDELTGNIIGVAIEVHGELGRHEEESTYRTALAMGLRDEGFQVDVEYGFDLRYRGKPVGTGAADLLVEDEVVLELKAVRSTTEEHFRQLGRNVVACGASRGLLLNFGEATLGIRRYIRADDTAAS